MALQNKMMKLQWQGRIFSIQPRIRLLRSFDQRSHSYLGYSLSLHGAMASQEGEFSVGIGQAAQSKWSFRVGDIVKGCAVPVPDPRIEPLGYHRVTGLHLLERPEEAPSPAPPWHDVPPDLPVYRERGHRRLDARTYETKCTSCIWGCCMLVEIIVDQWNPQKKRCRLETFCYGPKNCSLYRPGPTRKVPGRKGMTWEEEDWVDEDVTSHRTSEE